MTISDEASAATAKVIVHLAPGPIKILTFLGAALVLMKAAGITTLSWLWVLSPFWVIPGAVVGVLVFGALMFAIVFMFAVVGDAVNDFRRRRRQQAFNRLPADKRKEIMRQRLMSKRRVQIG